MKQILHRVNSLICTPKNSNHVRSHKIRPGKQILSKQNNPVAHHLNFILLIQFLQPLRWRDNGSYWTAPKYNFMKHTIVLCGSQFTHSIPPSKREAKIKNQTGFFVFDKFTLQVNLGDKSGGVKTSLLNILFSSRLR